MKEIRPDWLLDYKEDVFSQSGEDGIIKKILDIIPDNDKWCVEFGAWDGVFLSNTANLIKNSGYSAVLIEGSSEKFIDLKMNYSENSNVTLINAFVGFLNEDGLDHILIDTPIPCDFDLLSIDVDGNDYHIWNAVSKYQPKLLVVEFNPTIPTEIRFVQDADPMISQGSSLLSLVELAKRKGYELISVLAYNAFFVRAKYFPLFGIEDNSPLALRKSLEYITYLFSGFDGRIILRGCQELPWHNIKIKESRVQQLPKILQKFPCTYNQAEKILWYMRVVSRKLYEAPFVTGKKILSRLFLRDKKVRE